MAKFKNGDVVVCTRPDFGYNQKKYSVGDKVMVQSYANGSIFIAEDGYLYADHWELATPSPIPDTVTIGGVEYVRKPEPEHVWAWGQWARVKAQGLIVFVTGPVKDNGFVPVTHKCACGHNNTDEYMPDALTYISTATVPE